MKPRTQHLCTCRCHRCIGYPVNTLPCGISGHSYVSSLLLPRIRNLTPKALSLEKLLVGADEAQQCAAMRMKPCCNLPPKGLLDRHLVMTKH